MRKTGGHTKREHIHAEMVYVVGQGKGLKEKK